MGHRLTTCTFCGVGCGIYLETDGNSITGAYPSMSHPANEGRICVRGWNVHEVASSPDRLRHPLIRDRGTNRLHEASWGEALDFAARRLGEIRDRYGPRAIGFLSSARCSNEESYLLEKFARAVVGTNNVDHGTSVHRSKTIQVLSDMLGVPAATSSLADISKSDVILVDGIDLARQIPTVGGAVIRAKLRGAKIICTGTRRYRHVESADHFLQIKPRSTVCLYGAMAKVIVDRGLMDLAFIKARTRDYDVFLERVQQYDILWAAERCGVSPELIEEAAITFAKARAAIVLYSSGMESRGIEPIQAIVDLVLLTGNLGKEGSGLLPLTEHNNLQGSCDMGMLPGLLPGYAPVEDPASRARFEALWGRPLPTERGFDAQEMLGTLGGGALKALWLDRHNPLVTTAIADANSSLGKLEFVVQQHLFLNETASRADLVLPVVAFGEEQVTFTSTERRIQIAEQVVSPPEGPMPAWRQIVEVANRMGAGWRYDSPRAVMDEIGLAVESYEAADYDNLSRDYGRQWPCTKERPMGTERLFADGNGRPFRFALVERPTLPGGGSKDYPFALSFGFSLYYWHKNVLVQHSETLKREYQILLLDYPEGFVEVNVEDAGRLSIRDGCRIRLSSPTGVALTYARVTDEVKSGMVFVPYFLHDLTKQILGEASSPDHSVSAQVYVKLEVA